jgi:hypothetical protein
LTGNKNQSPYAALCFQKGIEMDNEKDTATHSGGVNISGGTITVGGDVVGRDKIVGTEISKVRLDHIFFPLDEAILAAPPQDQREAMQKLDALKSEVAKGKNAKDGVVAKLLEGLAGLVPSAESAIVSAFATPLLGGIAGPATKYVLDRIQGK